MPEWRQQITRPHVLCQSGAHAEPNSPNLPSAADAACLARPQLEMVEQQPSFQNRTSVDQNRMELVASAPKFISHLSSLICRLSSWPPGRRCRLHHGRALLDLSLLWLRYHGRGVEQRGGRRHHCALDSCRLCSALLCSALRCFYSTVTANSACVCMCDMCVCNTCVCATEAHC